MLLKRNKLTKSKKDAMNDIENVAFVLKSLLSQVQRVKIWSTDEDCGCDLIIQSDASIKIDTIAMDSISNFLDVIGYEVFIPEDTDNLVIQEKI